MESLKKKKKKKKKKTLLHRNLAMKFCTLNVCTIKNHNSGKKIKLEILYFFQTDDQITGFYFASFRFWPKLEKTPSQSNFSMKFG